MSVANSGPNFFFLGMLERFYINECDDGGDSDVDGDATTTMTIQTSANAASSNDTMAFLSTHIFLDSIHVTKKHNRRISFQTNFAISINRFQIRLTATALIYSFQ